ncbi:hypothetical protein ACFVIM_28030 [Streptomyces sp. NPDC057638]|uniref:hypothetical protein n=1 Tax=Streptomyces sp. NPDC057638 TaxID=3346190 RepID=UPI00368D0606
MTVNRTKTVTIATTIVAVAAALAVLTTLALRQGDSDDSTSERDSPARAERVDLTDRIDEYTARFGENAGYRQPTRTDRRTVAHAVSLFLDGHRNQAQQQLAGMDFALRTITDIPSGRSFAEIADDTEGTRSPRGWGRVYLALDRPVRWSVQVPHPVADRNTERLGTRVLLGSPGGVLVIAGAHRKAGMGNAADVAHRTDSVFDAVCDELTERGIPGIQIHGFADDSVPDHDVVASTGKGRVALAEGRELSDELAERGFTVCRGWVRDCPLEGRTNVQGRKAAAEDVPFLHVEFSNRLRTDTRRSDRAAAAIDRITEDWARAR